MADAADESRPIYPSLTLGLLSLRAFPTSFFAICEIVSVMLISCAGPSTQFHETSGECTVLRFLSPNEAYLVLGDVAFFMKQSLFIFKNSGLRSFSWVGVWERIEISYLRFYGTQSYRVSPPKVAPLAGFRCSVAWKRFADSVDFLIFTNPWCGGPFGFELLQIASSGDRHHALSVRHQYFSGR